MGQHFRRLALCLVSGAMLGLIAAPRVSAGPDTTSPDAVEQPASQPHTVLHGARRQGEFRLFAVTYDDEVSNAAQTRTTVTKIGYGRRSIVTIVSTPSGTYSSEALLSPHFRYPGITVEEIARGLGPSFQYLAVKKLLEPGAAGQEPLEHFSF